MLRGGFRPRRSSRICTSACRRLCRRKSALPRQNRSLSELYECYPVDIVLWSSSSRARLRLLGISSFYSNGLIWVEENQQSMQVVDYKRGPVAQLDRASVS